MRALTVLQPWAHAIAHCGKRVENRGSVQWLGGYKGPLLIHAGKGSSYLSDAACFEINLICSQVGGPDFPRDVVSAMPRLAREMGAVVAVATLAEVVHSSDAYKLPAAQRPWCSAGCYHLVLKDVRTLKTPVKASGMQGLWTPSRELVAAVMDSLEGKTAEQQSRGGSKAADPEGEKSGTVRGGGLFGGMNRML